MPYTVKVDLPNSPPGTMIQIHGLGVLENGKTVRVTDEQADLFRQVNGRPVDEDSRTVFELGPALDEANFTEGITVTKEEETTSTPNDEEEGSE